MTPEYSFHSPYQTIRWKLSTVDFKSSPKPHSEKDLHPSGEWMPTPRPFHKLVTPTQDSEEPRGDPGCSQLILQHLYIASVQHQEELAFPLWVGDPGAHLGAWLLQLLPHRSPCTFCTIFATSQECCYHFMSDVSRHVCTSCISGRSFGFHPPIKSSPQLLPLLHPETRVPYGVPCLRPCPHSHSPCSGWYTSISTEQ